MPDSPAFDPTLPQVLAAGAPVVILTGHYGVGKTNLALNLALACAAAGESVTLSDLDLVNPYFRSSDYPEVLERAGVRLAAPIFAGSTLDTPSVGGELFAHAEIALGQPGHRLIVDVGGDDAGATALGRYAGALDVPGVRMLHVVNAFRNLTAEPAEAVAVLREVEEASHLRVQGIVNNSHLCEQTTEHDVAVGRAWARDVADCAELPLVATCVPAHVSECCVSPETRDEPLLKVGRYVNTPWQ